MCVSPSVAVVVLMSVYCAVSCISSTTVGWFGCLCGGMYRGLSGEAGVMGGGLWCPLTVSNLHVRPTWPTYVADLRG